MTKLDKKQRSLIIGTILGKSNLHTFTKGRTWHYRAEHNCARDETYFLRKYILLSSFCAAPPFDSIIIDHKRNKTFKRFYFSTRAHDCFRFYANLFYEEKQGKFSKIIPKNIEKWLDTEVLAYLYMDAGGLKLRGKSYVMRICLSGFSRVCVKRLKKAIALNFGLSLTLSKIKKKKTIIDYKLYISEADAPTFFKLVAPYFLDSMKYKLAVAPII